MECFAKLVNYGNYFCKHSILDIWQGSEYIAAVSRRNLSTNGC